MGTFSKMGGYKPVEDVNQGPHGAGKGKVSPGHGQNTDAGGKDDLVPLVVGQSDPYKAKGSDWSVKDVAAFDKQTGPHGTASGKDDLATLGPHQEGARHVEDEGPGPAGSGTPTNWAGGGRSALIAAAFPIQHGTGEAQSEGGEISISESVDLKTGHIVGGSAQTRVREVPEAKVHIPGR